MAGRRFEDEDVGMENKKVSLVINRIGVEVRPEFNVVLAYDEIAGGMRAKEVFDDLVRRHGDLFKFVCQLWNFAVMREPELFEAAVRDASKAEMIVIATPKNQFPNQVRQWIGRWLPRKGAASPTLVVLLNGKAKQAAEGPESWEAVRQLVEGGGVAVLSKEVDWPARPPRFAVKSTEEQRREEPRRPAPVFSTNAGHSGWGLNE